MEFHLGKPQSNEFKQEVHWSLKHDKMAGSDTMYVTVGEALLESFSAPTKISVLPSFYAALWEWLACGVGILIVRPASHGTSLGSPW